MRSAVVMLACLLGVVVIAGCGGGGSGDNGSALAKEDYEQQMQALQADLMQSADELQQAFSDPSDISAMAAGLDDAADIFDDASTSLDEIEPPDDVAEPHQVMVDKTASAADAVREFSDTIENASLAELTQRLPEFQNIEEFDELEQAVDDIQAAGYDIGGSGSSP